MFSNAKSITQQAVITPLLLLILPPSFQSDLPVDFGVKTNKTLTCLAANLTSHLVATERLRECHLSRPLPFPSVKIPFHECRFGINRSTFKYCRNADGMIT